ncbi:TPA: hypothetical protein ACTXXA_002016 [Legionella anisa]
MKKMISHSTLNVSEGLMGELAQNDLLQVRRAPNEEKSHGGHK